MGHLLGLDLGGTNMKAAVLDADTHDVVETHTRPTDRSGPTATVAGLARFGADLVAELESPVRVGITLPGLFDELGRATVIPNIPGEWPGTPVSDPVAAAVGGDVTLINDARAFGLAEARLGAAKGVPDVIGLVLGTGVGGCVILDGRLRFGPRNTAGEIGHQVLDIDGPPCGCGNHGCLEALVRADVLAAAAGTATAEEAVNAARAGDARAAEAIRTAAAWIGIGLGNLATVLTPQCIVIGGGLAAAGDTLFAPVIETFRRRTPMLPPDLVQIVPAALGPWAGAIGAALAPTGT